MNNLYLTKTIFERILCYSLKQSNEKGICNKDVKFNIINIISNEMFAFFKGKKIKVINTNENKYITNFDCSNNNDNEEDILVLCNDEHYSLNNLGFAEKFNIPFSIDFVVIVKKDKKRNYYFNDILFGACYNFSSSLLYFSEKGSKKVNVYKREVIKTKDFMQTFEILKNNNDNNSISQKLEVFLTLYNLIPINPKNNKKYSCTILTNLNKIDISFYSILRGKFHFRDFGNDLSNIEFVTSMLYEGFICDSLKVTEMSILYLFAHENGLLIRDFNNLCFKNKVLKKNQTYSIFVANEKNITEIFDELFFLRK